MKRLLAILLTACAVQAQGDRMHFQLNYRPGDWITIGETRLATSIAVSYSDVYIGTLGGVIRYNWTSDQYSFPLTTSSGLLDNEVRLVAVDPRTGWVWVVTRLGFNLYNPQAEVMMKSVYAASGIDLNERVLSIGFDVSQTWIQTTKGFYVSPTSTLSPSRATASPDPGVSWQGALASRQKLPHFLPRQEFGYFYELASSSIVDREFRKFPIVSYTTDNQGNFWVATYGAGGWLVNGVTLAARPLPYGVASGDVRAIAIRDETMWFGGRSQFGSLSSVGHAVTSWNQEKDLFTYIPLNVVETVTCMLVDTSNVWAGTDQGLLRKDKFMQNWTVYGRNAGMSDNAILSLATDGTRIFVGTSSGLNVLTQGEKDWIIHPVEISAIRNIAILKILLKDDAIWLGTDNGIYCIDERRGHWFHYDGMGNALGERTLTPSRVGGIATNEQTIYFASQRSLVMYDLRSRKWESVNMNIQFLESGVNAMECDPHNIWIGTNAGLLRYLRKKQKWYFYSTQDGLAGDQIQSIALDGDYVWFGTNAGVTQFFWNAPHLRE